MPHHNFSILPQIAPDETLYSWCATVHAEGTGLSAVLTGLRLLDSPHATRQHDLPTSLAQLPILEGCSAFECVTMLRRHTIANFYWPFLSEAARRSVVSAIMVGTTNHWRRTLCSSSRTQPIEHPLKWCPKCVETDRSRFGRAYWHVQHQFPTTMICRVHQTTLHQIPGRHKHWMLPPQGIFQSATWDLPELTSSTVVERIGAALAEIDSVNISLLRAFTLRGLRDAGVIISANGASHERIERWFAQTRTAAWCKAARNGLERLGDGHWIPAMLWRRHLGNAVRWVVLWSALDWESADAAAVSFGDACRGTGHEVGGQLMLFEADEETQTRAPPYVWEAFSECDSYAEVMAKLQRSRGDVVRWLDLDPDLRAHWRARLRSEKRIQCLSTVRTALTANPNFTRRALEDQYPADIRWLREHAARELDELLRAIPARGGEQSELFSRGTRAFIRLSKIRDARQQS